MGILTSAKVESLKISFARRKTQVPRISRGRCAAPSHPERASCSTMDTGHVIAERDKGRDDRSGARAVDQVETFVKAPPPSNASISTSAPIV